MASFCKVVLLGNLTRDPELRVTPKGTAICQFGIALNRQFKGEDGTMREEITFVDIEAWGKQGETIQKFCTKGKQLLVEGRLKTDSWEDKTTGQKRSKMKVVLEGFQFVGGRDGEQAASDFAAPPARNPPPARRELPAKPSENLDEDVPF